jgi:hypothetical protein
MSFGQKLRSVARQAWRRLTHAEQIEALLSNTTGSVLVETGSGLSTVVLARVRSATVISCDCNQQKIDRLRSKCPSVEFRCGDSVESLKEVASRYPSIDFLFLDSAASAMQAFREFMAVEGNLKPGAVVLLDNAAIPEYRGPLLSPVRKGKILVPYLLASPCWEVSGHPRSGDSMVSAVRCDEPNYADPRYEDPNRIDSWQPLFKRKL